MTITNGTENGQLLRDVLAAHVQAGDRRHRERYETHPDAVQDASESDRPGSVASLVRRANHDELTGLANRAWFIVAAERMRSTSPQSANAALFLIDLDGFKAINDTWGHGAGDDVLIEVGHRLERLFPHYAVAARLGGDEFALWVEDCPEAQAQLVAERIVSALTEPLRGELMLAVGASVGWVVTDGTTPMSALMSRADIALYAVKERGGRGHQMFNRELAAERLEGRVLLRELRQGFERRQFKAALQPLVDKDGTVVGHEILARWQHPRRGLMLPGDFLPLVKASASSSEFNSYMLDLAVSLAAERQENRLPLWVNLTEESLNDETVAKLRNIVHNDLTVGSPLVVEISEQAPAESPEALKAIEQIAELGIKVAIDDFGAGYSRLGAMARLPITYVKVDRQFVTGISGDETAQRVVGAVFDLIHAIGATAIAEGVETEEDSVIVQKLGCDMMQGWLFGRPELVNSATDIELDLTVSV